MSDKVQNEITTKLATEKPVNQSLRDKNISCELYPDAETKLQKQLKYASRKDIPYVIIIGPEEVKEKKVTLKEMETGKQQLLNNQELVNFFSKNI